MRFMIVLALCCVAVFAAPNDSPRIIGGSLTTIDQYPQLAGVLFSFNLVTYDHSCGGSIINSRSILTAAHCTELPAVHHRVRVGSTFANSGGVVHSVSVVVNHPQYNVGPFMNNDISIVRTPSDIVFGNNVQTAFFAGANYQVADNSVVWAAGWGVTEFGSKSEQLRHVQVWAVNQEICRQNYASIGLVINKNMLCSGWLGVGGRDQCGGDSGGPLYHNGVVVGVCSFGNNCALPNYPGINARVSRYAAWIQANA